MSCQRASNECRVSTHEIERPELRSDSGFGTSLIDDDFAGVNRLEDPCCCRSIGSSEEDLNLLVERIHDSSSFERIDFGPKSFYRAREL